MQRFEGKCINQSEISHQLLHYFMKYRIPEDLKDKNLPQIMPIIHKKLLKRALFKKKFNDSISNNLLLIMKKAFPSFAIITLGVLILTVFSTFFPKNNIIPEEFKILVAKAEQAAELNAQQGKYYHQKFTMTYPSDPMATDPSKPLSPEDITKPRTTLTEMIETWTDTETGDFIAIHILNTGKTYGEMFKNKEFFLFDIEKGELDIRSQGSLTENSAIFNPTFHLDHGRLVGKNLKAVINGGKAIGSLKDLFPYSDLFNPQYAGLQEINGMKMEVLTLEGVPNVEHKSRTEFYFDAETFQLKLVRASVTGDTKGYIDENGTFIQMKEDIFHETKYLLSEYSSVKPQVKIGGQILDF